MDQFYSVGEGLGGISVQAKRISDNAVFSTTSFASGGYQLELDPGVYEVSFSGPGITGTLTQVITLDSVNKKFDINTARIQSLTLTFNTTP